MLKHWQNIEYKEGNSKLECDLFGKFFDIELGNLLRLVEILCFLQEISQAILPLESGLHCITEPRRTLTCLVKVLLSRICVVFVLLRIEFVLDGIICLLLLLMLHHLRS